MNNAVVQPSIAAPNKGHSLPPESLIPGSNPVQPGSIHAILTKNNSTRLFVHPLEWTDDHLKALDVVISNTTAKPVLDDDIKRKVADNKDLLGAVFDLEGTEAVRRDQATRDVVTAAANVIRSEQQDVKVRPISLEYNKLLVASLPPLISAWYRPKGTKCSWENPIWAYTDHKWTSTARRRRFKNRSWSFAMKSIKSKHELAIDPVYVAILITLAQVRRKNEIKHGVKESRSYWVTLFVPDHELIMTKLVQYTADIPYTYLQKLETPYKFYDSTLHIEKRSLPTSEPAIISQAMRTAFLNISGSLKSPLPTSLKRKALTELNLNLEDQNSVIKRRKVHDL